MRVERERGTPRRELPGDGDLSDLLDGPTLDVTVRPALEAALTVAREGEDDTPSIPAPTPLRPFLRFAKLPPRALTATRKALDGDDEFRQRVAEWAEEEAVGRAGWLYLNRPEGWKDELAELVQGAGAAAREEADRKAEHDARRRLSGVQEALRRAEEGAARARADAAEAAAALAEQRRLHVAAEAAAAAATRRVDEVMAERDRARAASAAAKAELETLRRRVAELEAQRRAAPVPPEVEAAPPAPAEPVPEAPPPAPPFDVASVSTGLEDAAGAATALAERLRAVVASLAPARPTPEAPPAPAVVEPPPPPRRPPPPPPRRRPVPLPPATFDDSVEAAEHLVRVPGIVLVVDGYNISQAGWPEHPIAEQRRRLVDALAELAARSGADVRVVFDGSEMRMPGVVPMTPRSVRVSFSAPGVEADDEVLELVEHLPVGRPVVVASSDRRVQAGAARSGANVISNEQLLAVLRR